MSSSYTGRPKGSTYQKKREGIKNFKEFIIAITEAYDNGLTQYKDQNKYVIGWYLKQVIKQKKES